MGKPMTQFSSWLWRRTAFLRSTAGLAILAVACVGLRLLWIHDQRPAHLGANAAAYGAIRNFYGAAWMNHDGSRFIYVADADDRGHALFLDDTLTGKRRLILTDKDGTGYWKDDFQLQAGPWSPDDRYFLCCVSNRVMICSADANQKAGVIEDKPFSEAVWLTPAEFAYVTDGKNLCIGRKRGDGQWERKLILSRDTPIASLTAIGSDTVAWLEDGSVICRADLSEGSPRALMVTPAAKVAAPPMAGLTLWLDASMLRQPDQSPVTDLADLGPKRNDAVWNGHPPVFDGTNSPRALDGKGTIHFAWLGSATNGTGLKTRAPIGITGAVPRSVFVVMRHDADRPMMVSMGDTSAHGALFAVEWSDKLYLPTGWWADNYMTLASTNWNVLETIYDGASQRGYLNGVLRGTASAKLNTVERGLEIGFRDGQDAKAAEGDFAELLVYDRALSSVERRQVEDYLGGKWFGKTTLSSQGPLVWYDTGLDGLTGLAYSKETEELLINRSENSRDSVWLLNTADGPHAKPTQIKEGQSVLGAQWAGANQFVYASRLDTRSWITLADLSGNDKKQLLQLWDNGTFDWFRMTPDQKQLFLFGNISNTLAEGIWHCDLASDAWRPVISCSDDLTTNAQGVITLHEPMNFPGGNVTCTIYRPANFDPHKKYPLVIGDTQINDPSHGEAFMTGLAACGACVAVVERLDWNTHLDQWATNVMALYQNLAANDPAVDAGRVFLFGQSDETEYMSRILEKHPGLWRGAIFLNPGVLPDFSKSPQLQARPRIFLDAGSGEHEEDRFNKYQKDALISGAVVEFFIYPGETHRIVGSAARLERARRVAHFVFAE
jgi:hypothetical protein